MTTENKARLYAAASTAVIAIVVLAIMAGSHLAVSKEALTPPDKGEIVLDEEFIEIIDMPARPNMVGDRDARATADEQNPSQPTPEAGTDLANQGPEGDAPKPVTQKHDSPMKVTEKEKKPAGPTAEELKKREEDEIKRRADNEVANAFNKAQGQHNTANGSTDQGMAGATDGNSVQGTLTGRGTGTAGGGWSIPNYGAVKSPVTGSVKLTVTIDRQGNVTNVRVTGGDAPAATNSAVQSACIAEVKKHKFFRANPDNASETSTAYITYTFR